MLKNNINRQDAELVLKKIMEYGWNLTPDRKLWNTLKQHNNKQIVTPFYISWELTAACNLRCKHCCFAGQDYNSVQDIDKERAISFVKELIDADVIKVMLTGGEPFLYQNIFDIIHLLKSHNIIVEITTNALLLNNEMIQRLACVLNPLCDYVQVSLDGAEAETHELTRGKGTFDKTVDNIKLLKKNGVNVTVNFVVTSQNIYDMTKLYQLVSELEVGKITYSRVFAEYNSGLLPDDNELFDETIKLLKLENERTKIELKLFTIPEIACSNSFSFFSQNTDAKFCTDNFSCHQWEKLHVRSDGEVFLCLHSSNQSLFSLGNIKEMLLPEILDSRSKNILFGKRSVKDEKCTQCNFAYLCKCGCPINSWLKYGDINKPDPVCHKS